jgi:hypothetical protein
MLTQISVKSIKLQNLMDDFTKQTGRRIEVQAHTSKTGDFYFAHCDISPSDKIIITLDLERLGVGNNVEPFICHEFFHAALTLQHGFYVYATREPNRDSFVASLVADIESTIQDVVVHKMMNDIGIAPFSKKDMHKMKERSQAIKHSHGLPDDLPSISFKRIVLITALARMGLRTLRLGRSQSEVIHNFMKTIKRSAPELYAESQNIMKILSGYEILTPKGNRDAIEAIFQHWGLVHDHLWLRYDHQSGSLQPSA